ncbi:MAG TPA: hypothetical protein VFQ76_15075 [Longimicrobiaceae bacterium]|nr:hypothetical protein [Longimicrobiaceae bacterium]
MARRSRDPKEEARQQFIRGERDRWDAGGYGFTVTCVAINGCLKLKWTRPRRRQITVFAHDTPSLREKLTGVASGKALKLRSGEVLQATHKVAGAEQTTELATVGRAWLHFLHDHWPGIGDPVIHGGRKELREYYLAMSTAERELVGDPDYLLSVIRAMRRVTAFPAFSSDRPIQEIEPIDWTRYTQWRRTRAVTGSGKPYAYNTIATDFTRFNTVLTHCRTKRRRWWGNVPDPLEGADVLREDAELPEITEEECTALIRTLRAGLPGTWRALAAVRFAYASGRRIGAIGADRLGFETDGLCATDFTSSHGRVFVVWRASAAKGGAYGRGDEMIPAAWSLAATYRWLCRFHPNPLGAAHPLLWAPGDPARPVTYAALNKTFKAAWNDTFGQQAPYGLAFHGFCRTVATTVGDELGLDKAAEYTGRTRRTIERYCKRKRLSTFEQTVKRLDEIRR